MILVEKNRVRGNTLHSQVELVTTATAAGLVRGLQEQQYLCGKSSKNYTITFCVSILTSSECNGAEWKIQHNWLAINNITSTNFHL